MKNAVTDIDVASWITEHRKKKGWTEKELAKQLDISQPLVSQWEKSRTRPNAEWREKLLLLLG
jgi:ribosome-binding protein aMBF1 (putative translation factor)